MNLSSHVIIAGAFFLGLMLGSFASMASYRLPRKLGWGGRSFCDGCGRVLTSIDLIPLVSWMIWHGRTRCCHKKISARYPLIELTLGAACAGAAAAYGLSLMAGLLIILATILVILCVIEAETGRISFVLAAMALGLSIIPVVGPTLVNAVPLQVIILLLAQKMGMSLAVGFLIWLLYRRVGEGWLLLSMLPGLWLSDQQLIAMMNVCAAVIVILFLARYRYRQKPYLLLATPLAIGLYICILLKDVFYVHVIPLFQALGF